MFFGWSKCYVDDDGYPSENETRWIASCFILFTRVVYVGEVSENPDWESE